ncbi:MAG: modification methylase [Helicobacteraceae bacterium CG2_30_36_10]|nr:MAG: modification methylase [Helicobacteraceae bacterium CG2_30_36_10]
MPKENQAKKATNSNLRKANKEKNDEFYTQLPDIERELFHYKEHFKGKTIFCNCDDPEESNFFRYFALNFEKLGLTKVITTHFEKDKSSYKLELEHDLNDDGRINELDRFKTPFKQNGDFRSPESIEILKSCDIVVTNPPFSLFREYVAQLIEYDKKFVIIGSLNAITYKEIFSLIKENKLWIGYGFLGGNAYFKTPATKEFASGVYSEETGLVKFRNVTWFTNLEIQKRHEEMTLFRKYHESEYLKYDNHEAINVDKIKDIPDDFDGVMGVPITFLDKYNPNQFELLGIMNTGEENKGIRYENTPHGRPIINGVEKYLRILIKRRNKGQKYENRA